MMTEKRKTFLTISVFVLAVIITIVGAIRGETAEVVKKAVNICLECVGIG